MKHNEDSRVKIPAILHLCGLGYKYVSLRDSKWDKETNVFTDIFSEAIARINPEVSHDEVQRIYSDLSLDLENEDLGKAFYQKLTARTGIKLIDFENFDRNSFHVVTELPCGKDDDEFRPDITLLINGMPLVFIEVKKPNNRDGVLAERSRMITRNANKNFRKFLNLTQLMVFSNNMEYDDGEIEPIQGAFYTTTTYGKPHFNYFREEDESLKNVELPAVKEELEDFVLKDTNLISIKHSSEFKTNKDPNSATNRICTSLFSRDRLAFMLRYSIAYVQGSEADGLQKHVMRYPQMFASKAISTKLDEGVRKGIIWHTQGSGKTALAFYNVHYLTDYYQEKGVVPKFYFIVDRLDLLIQASREFEARGLKVHTINSRDEFASDIKSALAVHNDSGVREITVVNIQKFEDDPSVVRNTDYSVNLQRIYFLDEVHRSYNPEGSFLANLKDSDPNSIKIGLTGTPLLGDQFNSKSLFGGYIHKYYYNASIKDGYTLRLIREEIESNYRIALKKQLEEIKLLKGEAERKYIYAHRKFVEPILDYIVEDFEKARISFDNNGIGGMVICDSSNQAKMMNEIFLEKYAAPQSLNMAAEDSEDYSGNSRKPKTAALILHDAGTKQERKDQIEDFKDGKIDLLFVFNMLQTGFDAPRLKKLYLGRVVKSHNLLQALTRVNRTYRNFRFGYVVDFADIQKEFDKTNQAYFKELQGELGDEMEHYSDLFIQPEEVDEKINTIKKAIFHFDTQNAEVFSQQISEIDDRTQMLEIVKALNDSKSLYNPIRLSGHYEMLEKLDFRKFTRLATMANDRLALINQKQALESGDETTNLLNVALGEVIFAFTKIGEGELVLADELKGVLRRTREALSGSMDKGSPASYGANRYTWAYSLRNSCNNLHFRREEIHL